MNPRFILIILLSLFVCAAASAADTDISTYDDVIYVESFNAQGGEEITLSIQAKCTFNLRSYQFKMHLPEGISFVLDNDGYPISEISANRSYTKPMNYRAEILSDGDLMVVCSSQLGGNYQGVTGEICTVKIKIDKKSAGQLPISLYWVKACDPQYKAYKLPSVSFSADVKALLLGDVNGDDLLTIADITTLIDLRNNSTIATSAQFARADIDEDNELTENDLEQLQSSVLLSILTTTR